MSASVRSTCKWQGREQSVHKNGSHRVKGQGVWILQRCMLTKSFTTKALVSLYFKRLQMQSIPLSMWLPAQAFGGEASERACRLGSLAANAGDAHGCAGRCWSQGRPHSHPKCVCVYVRVYVCVMAAITTRTKRRIRPFLLLPKHTPPKVDNALPNSPFPLSSAALTLCYVTMLECISIGGQPSGSRDGLGPGADAAPFIFSRKQADVRFTL